VQSGEHLLNLPLILSLLSGVAAGLLIGIERGWRQREKADGTRVAGVRTFTLIGGSGSLIALIAREVSASMAAIILGGMVVLLLVAFLRDRARSGKRDATTMVAAMVALALGLIGGAGYAAVAIAGAALATFVLATRIQSHKLLRSLSQDEVQAIARFAVISLAVLPFLPDGQYGPYDAWNPFKLWLVLVLVTGFSVAGYVANRVIGENKGTITTAVIGGSYSSTAVTASLASRIAQGASGPFATGIALASAVMYLRVLVLTAILAPRAALPLAWLLGPAGFAAFAVSAIVWRFERSRNGTSHHPLKRPFDLLPAFGFLIAMGAASLLVRWAEVEFGEAGGAWSLFIAGSFDVDAAIVAYSGLPRGSVSPPVAALALGGTVGVNMAFKIAIVVANAGLKAGRSAALSLLASFGVLLGALALGLIQIAG
jgi:uncharacterized membrane protein (DUF4010 family)